MPLPLVVSEPSTVEVRVHRLRHHTTERDFNTAIPAPVSPIRIPAHAVDSLYYTKVYSHICGGMRGIITRFRGRVDGHISFSNTITAYDSVLK